MGQADEGRDYEVFSNEGNYAIGFTRWRFLGLPVALVLLAADLKAQDGPAFTPSYPIADQVALVPVGGDVQMTAVNEALPPENAPPPPLAPPNSPAADLERRVADLEKQLAQYAKPAATQSDGPTKPLIAPSGRIQFDSMDFTQNAASQTQFGNVANAVGFRRARIALLGEYKTIDYIIEMDFAQRGVDAAVNSNAQSTAFKDVYVQMRDLPVLGNVRVGHFKECFGLEQLTSDNYITFMERSLCDEGTFVPGRNDGIMAFNWTENQRVTWAVGAFANDTGYDQPPTFQFDHGGAGRHGAGHVSSLVRRGQRRPWTVPHRLRLRLPRRPQSPGHLRHTRPRQLSGPASSI